MTTTASGERVAEGASWQWAVGISTLLVLVRLAAVRLSPLQLYDDEAQYWLWAQHLDFGYFTKPPLIAWLIRLTTFSSDAEPMVRASSPLLHGLAGLFVFCAARRLYHGRTALAALCVYQLTPAVQLGAFVMTTDTPMVACLSGALWAYAAMQTGRGRWRAATGLGVALGLGFLAKYAVLYSVIGLVAHLVISREARRAWSWPAALVAIGAFCLIAAPNVIWNVDHRFVAVGHLQQEAAWGERQGGVLKALGFLGDQFGVFGPLPFAVLLGGGVWLGVRRRLTSADTLLLCWTAPPLLIVLGQALIAGAKANWAAAAFAPGSILVAAWMLRWARPRLLVAGLAVQAAFAIGALAVVISPPLADRIGLSIALRGVRGGRESAQLIVGQARAAQLAGPLSAVAIDERELYSKVAYYGRGYFGRGGPPLKAWLARPYPQYQGELSQPLTAADGARVLAVSKWGVHTARMRAQFRTAGPVSVIELWLDRKHTIKLQTFVGEGFQPPPDATAPPRTPPRSSPSPRQASPRPPAV